MVPYKSFIYFNKISHKKPNLLLNNGPSFNIAFIMTLVLTHTMTFQFAIAHNKEHLNKIMIDPQYETG